MATELDKLVVRIEADLKDLKKGLAQANSAVARGSSTMGRSLKGLDNSLTRIRASMLKFGTIAGVAFSALALRSIIKTGVEIERLEIRFNSLFGSVEEGNAAFEQLLEYAGTVPFSLGEIQAGSGSLAVVAKDAEHLRDILEITGNVAVIAGLDFRTTASQIQRVFSGGLAAADIFREKGISQIIKDTGMMTDTVEGAAAAFEAVFSGDGKFANATKEMATTIEGTFSMIGDTLQAFTIAVAEGFFVELGRSLEDFNKMLQDNRKEIERTGKEIGESLGNALNTVRENIDLVVIGFKGFIALQVASVFARISVTAGTLAASLGLLNIALLANPVVATGVAIVAGLTTLIALFADLDKVANMVLQTFILLKKLNPAVFLSSQSKGGDIGRTDPLFPSTLASGDLSDDAGFFGEEIRRLEAHQEEVTKVTKENFALRAEMTKLQMDRIAKIRGEAFDKEQLELEEVRSKFEEIGNETAKALGKAVVSGRDFKDNMVDIFRSVAQQVAELIIQLHIVKPLIESINRSFGIQAPVAIGTADATSTSIANLSAFPEPSGSMIFGARARGGPVQANMPYMVGEMGPEMFVPSAAGNIIANNKLSGGQPIVVEQNLNFATGISQTVKAEVLNLLPAIQESTMSAVRDARLRGGRFAKDFGA